MSQNLIQVRHKVRHGTYANHILICFPMDYIDFFGEIVLSPIKYH